MVCKSLKAEDIPEDSKESGDAEETRGSGETRAKTREWHVRQTEDVLEPYGMIVTGT